MAQQESTREDLMREAAALRVRGEFLLPRSPHPVVVGFRDNGGCSLYFGEDPCYHFNHDGQLRRAFVGGTLYRTQGHTLAALRRERTHTQTQLVRRDLDPAAMAAFLDDMHAHIQQLLDDLREHRAPLLREHPDDSGIGAQLLEWLPSVVAQQQPLADAIATRRT